MQFQISVLFCLFFQKIGSLMEPKNKRVEFMIILTIYIEISHSISSIWCSLLKGFISPLQNTKAVLHRYMF